MCLHSTPLLLLADLSLNDTGSRDAQKITLSVRLSPTSVDCKLNEVCSIFTLVQFLYYYIGGAENAGHEIDGREIGGPMCQA